MGNQKSTLENKVHSGALTVDEALELAAQGIAHDAGADNQDAAVAAQCARWMKQGNMDQGQMALCCNQGCAGADAWRLPTGDSCGEDGHMYTGSLLKQYPQSGYKGHPQHMSSCDCQKMCAGTPGCVGWQVTDDRRICQLKRGGGHMVPFHGWRGGMWSEDKATAINIKTTQKFCAANQNGQCKTVRANITKQQQTRAQTCHDSINAYTKVQKGLASARATVVKLKDRQAKADATVAEIQKQVAAQQHSLAGIQTQRAWAQGVVAKTKVLSPIDKFVNATPDDQIAMVNTAIDGFHHFGVDAAKSVVSALKLSPAQKQKVAENCNRMIANLETLRDSVYWWRTTMPMKPSVVREAVESLVNKGIPTFVDPFAKSIDMGYAAQESNVKQRIANLQASAGQATATKARAQTNIDKLTSHVASVTQSADKAVASAKKYCWGDPVEPQGCWQDRQARAMTAIGGRAMYPQECFHKASAAGYTYMGLQDYNGGSGQAACFGAHSPSEYQRYGRAAGDCDAGGGPRVNAVYKIR